jgi:hypothetical protein
VLAEGVKLAGRDLVALDGVVGGVKRPHICQKTQGGGGGISIGLRLIMAWTAYLLAGPSRRPSRLTLPLRTSCAC